MKGEYQYLEKVTRGGEAACPWCGTPFRPRRTGGSVQRFCRTACKTAFWTSARRWVWKAIEAGLLTPSALREISEHARPDSVAE